jgi:hypothetical protein
MIKPTDNIRLAVDLSEEQAEALAQMVKRFLLGGCGAAREPL